MIRSKGEAGTGNVVEAVRHMRADHGEIRRLTTLGPMELLTAAKALQAPSSWCGRRRGRAAAGRAVLRGGIATPADAALMMQLGAEAVFVGSGIFKSSDPARARAIVEATTHFDEPERVAAASREASVRRCPGSRSAALDGQRRTVAEARLVTAPRSCSPSRAGSRHTRGRSSSSARAREVRVPEDLDGSTGSSSPEASAPR